MIACISPTEADLAETLNTLRYANRAKNMQKPPIPSHLLEVGKMASAKKRRLAAMIPPTPAKFQRLNNTVGPSTPFQSAKKKVGTPKLNATVALTSTNMKSIPKYSDSLENISEEHDEETLSEISTIYPPSASNSLHSTTTSAAPEAAANMTLMDVSMLSPLLRKFAKQFKDDFFQTLETTLKTRDVKIKTPNRSSPKETSRRSARLPAPVFDDSADETLISGPAFTASRNKMRHGVEEEVEDLIAKKTLSALKDVTNNRRSCHKEAVEKTASPSLCTKSLKGKENDEVEQMAKSMGINSPLSMFDDDDDNLEQPSRITRMTTQPKRSVRRTTMLPPELNRTLSESGIINTKDRRRSSRLEAMHKFNNPLEVKSNWRIFDQGQHNQNILDMLNSANLTMLQRLPAIGPKTAFILHTHKELRGPFESLEALKAIPGLPKSFFNKLTKAHQIIL
jgi:hypothetical protein